MDGAPFDDDCCPPDVEGCPSDVEGCPPEDDGLPDDPDDGVLGGCDDGGCGIEVDSLVVMHPPAASAIAAANTVDTNLCSLINEFSTRG